jgi:hypothetical protein
MGYAKGLHKMHSLQLAIGNLPADDRFDHDNILLYGAVNSKIAKRYGMARVLCGVDADGTQHDEPNFAADMRQLHEGVWMELTSAPEGIPRRIRLRAWVAVLATDFMEAGALLPFMESPSAHHPCRCCNFDQSSAEASVPFSFLSGASSPRGWKLRSWRQLQTALQCNESEWSSVSYSQGVNKRVFAFHPSYIPLVNPTMIAPQDAMHLFMDGITRHELAWLMYLLVSRRHITWERLTSAFKNYGGWPPGVRIPPLHKKIREGVAGNLPRPGATLGMSASQVMYAALHRCDLHPQNLTCPRDCSPHPCACHVAVLPYSKSS